jgi:hypothetical protein
MKTLTRFILIVLLIAVPAVSSTLYGQTTTTTTNTATETKNVKANPIGKWKVEIPYAPDGFQTSKMTVAKVDDRYTVEINFEEMAFVILGEKVTFIDKVLKFTFWVEDTEVVITLKFPEEDKMEGVVDVVIEQAQQLPITATRIKDQK